MLSQKSGSIDVDLRVFELLASRLCHDVVGPVGAVNNGMEILEDEDDSLDMMGEAISLVSKSARQATDALQFYRMAYGMAGAQVGSDLSELAELSARYGKKSKAEIIWQDVALPMDSPDGCGKLLLNLSSLAMECLPRGGKITVTCQPSGERLLAQAVAEGEGARMRDEHGAALHPNVKIEELTPRNVQGYFTRLLARRLGSELDVDATVENEVRLSVAL